LSYANKPVAATVSFVLLALVLTGCSSGPEVTGDQEAVVEASGEVEASRETSDLAANDRVAYDVPIRLNPSKCPCPEHEVWVYGAWQRVWLDGTPDNLQQARTVARTGGGKSTVRGALTTLTRPTERNVSYPVFEHQ
jgi:hypothetical protein